MSKLSSSDTILLHLKNYWNVRGEFPIAITQEGIAQATNIRRSHVPRILQKMKRSGLVEERLGHVEVLKRRIKIYFLTEVGFRKTQEILAELLKLRIIVLKEAGEMELSLGEACTLLNMKPLDILNLLTPNNMLIVPEDVTEEFLGRGNELEELNGAFLGKAKVIALYGSNGIGKTSLAKRFLRELPENWKILWYNLEDKTSKEFFTYFSRHLGLGEDEHTALADEVCSVLRRTNTFMIFDGYFQIEDELVDFFSYLVKKIEYVDGVKALFIINEATPSYCRFYKLDSVKRGLVQEIRIKGLDKGNALRLLGADDIEENAFNRIYLMTKGCPLFIKLIRDENINQLKNNSRFTPPEIKLLIHYKNLKRNSEKEGKP